MSRMNHELRNKRDRRPEPFSLLEARADTILADRQAIEKYKTLTAQADFLLAQPKLTEFEKDFVSNIKYKFGERSSIRQKETLTNIFHKYQAKPHTSYL
jgi:hypothetical protein